jgi:RHS repeat-associated protein
VQERATDGGTLLVQATYVYDVFNNRIEDDEWTSASGTTTVTKTAFDDQGQVWADLTNGNALQTRYLYMPGQVAPVARVASGAVSWLVTERQGSVVNVLDGSGNLIGTLVYDGFGNTTTETNSATTGRVTFTGLVNDRNEGLLKGWGRVYNPATGNWEQQDPIRFKAGDPKLDRYVGNNPTNATDPSGLQGAAGAMSPQAQRSLPSSRSAEQDRMERVNRRFAAIQANKGVLDVPGAPQGITVAYFRLHDPKDPAHVKVSGSKVGNQLQTTVRATGTGTLESNAERELSNFGGGKSWHWKSGSVVLYLKGGKPGELYTVDFEVKAQVSRNSTRRVVVVEVDYKEDTSSKYTGFAKIDSADVALTRTTRDLVQRGTIRLTGEENKLQVTEGNLVPTIAVVQPTIYTKGEGDVGTVVFTIRVVSVTKIK